MSQTHENWHLYVANDGGRPEIVEQCLAPYASAFADRITIIHNAVSQGMEGASNIAISKADGDFLAFLDDDDTWHPWGYSMSC